MALRRRGNRSTRDEDLRAQGAEKLRSRRCGARGRSAHQQHSHEGGPPGTGARPPCRSWRSAGCGRKMRWLAERVTQTVRPAVSDVTSSVPPAGALTAPLQLTAIRKAIDSTDEQRPFDARRAPDAWQAGAFDRPHPPPRQVPPPHQEYLTPLLNSQFSASEHVRVLVQASAHPRRARGPPDLQADRFITLH